MAEIKEFDYEVEGDPVQFKVTGELFKLTHPSRLPANVNLRYTETMMRGHLYEAHIRYFQDCLLEEYIVRFTERLDSKKDPITLHQMAKIANWMMTEVYGANPTDESKS